MAKVVIEYSFRDGLEWTGWCNCQAHAVVNDTPYFAWAETFEVAKQRLLMIIEGPPPDEVVEIEDPE